VVVAISVALAVSLAGCSLSVPSDPEGTLAHVTGGELRVGVTIEPGLVDPDGSGVSGPLVDLVQDFSATIHTEPEWTIASEETLVGLLEDGELDLLIGGFTDKSPWTDRAGMTRGYQKIDGADGRSVVLLVPLGENAFLTKLESFLDEEVGP